jgi:hypothetical protein
MKCRDCWYWVEAERTERSEDCGGCVYTGGYYPMFLDENCALIEPYKSEVEREHGGSDCDD